MNKLSLKNLKAIFVPTGFIFLFIVAGCLILLALLLDGLLEFPELVTEPWSILASAPFLWSGLFLVFWSILIFFKANGAKSPLNPPSTLVTAGPYAYSRNPMLTGVFFLTFGLGIISKSIFLTLMFTPAFIFLMVLVLRKVEEPELARKFGEQYMKYKADVPMFLPRFSFPKISVPKLKLPDFLSKFRKKAE